MLRIGYDAKRAFNNSSGLGNYSRAMIHILSEYYPNNEYILYTPKEQEKFARQFEDIANIRVQSPNFFWKTVPSLWRRYYLTKITAKKVDIFHGLSHELPIGIEKTNVKTIVTIHDLIAWRHPEYFKWIDSKIYRKKQKHACEIADVVIAISQQTKQDIIEILKVDPQKIRVVYQPCDTMFYKSVTEEGEKMCAEKYLLPERYILSVGTIETRKNLMTTLRAMQFIPEDICLVAIGRKTEYANTVAAEAKKMNLSGRLRFIDNADFSDFPAIYSGALAFVYPSFYEGFGIPILEAMNCGVPVITSNVTSLPEVGGKAALYIHPDDYKTLGEHINNILNDKKLRIEMIRAGRLQAAEFSEQKIADALWSIYREVCAN
ncbi:MAG: glycosyltransferase family 4 protein [Bacteroidales bacterium]|nr:glycosyltransferase family 4 protein [Bacteroidales bacterium]